MKKHLVLTILALLGLSVRMYSQLPASPTLALANVPEASQYGVMYELDIPSNGNFSSLASINYAVNNAAQTVNYTRVAYMLQLDNQWVWVSMDKFNTTNAQLSLPFAGSGIVWQQIVTNMNVYSSTNAAVTNTIGANGNIEIWPHCYNTTGNLTGIGGSNTTYDFNDVIGSANCHGSFQIHNYGQQETIFGYSSFTNNNTDALGIGNNTGNTHPDWTFMANAGNYTVKKLWILVNNGVFIATPPSAANVNACVNGTIAALTVSAGVNTGTITSYQWYSNTLNSNTGGTLVATNNSSLTTNSYTPSTSSAGTLYYYCRVNGTGSSSDVSDVSGAITVGNPTVTVTGAATICAGKTATLTASSSGAGTFTWSTGSTGATLTVSPVANTSYSASFTNSLGCIGSSTAALVTVNPLPTLSIAGPTAICVGQTASLVASGATTYTWSTASNVSSITASPANNTSYTVTGTTAGCTGSTTAALNVNPNPVITVNNGSICTGQSFTISPNGASTYTIQGGNSIVNPTSNASYTVIGTSTAGCVSTAFATSNVTVNPIPVISVNSGTICAGQSFVMNPSGASTYTVQGGNTTVSPLTNSTYTVIGTSTAGCISQAFATSSVQVNAIPTVAVNSGSICAGQNFNIVPSGASTYTIQGGNSTVNPTSNATYTVIGTSSAGCISQNTATSSVVVNPVPVITVNNGAICAGQSFTLTPNGASTYTVQGGNLVVSPTTNSTYTVAGTSAAGCVSQAFASSSVTVNPIPVITVNSGSICAGQSFNLIPGGASTYTVQGGNLTVSPTANSTYTVAGTSAAGCVSQTFATSTIVVNANPTITVNSGSICVGQSFTISPSGASTYTIQGGNSTVNPTANTSYTVVGTNAAGCVSQTFATSNVTVNALPTLAITGANTLCAGNSVSLSASGANTYTWSTTANTSTVTVSPTSNTTYSVSGTSLAGCNGNTATLAVTVNTLPVLAITGTNALCAGSTVTLSANGASTYTWNTGSNATSISANPANTSTYSLTGRSAAGCAGNTATFVLTVNPNPALTITGASGICTGQNASLTANGAATYSWSTGSTSQSIVTTPAVNTTYTVTGVSPLGCSTTTTQLVTVQASLAISVTGPSVVCNGQTANLSGLGGVTYTWNTGATTATIAPTITTTTTFSIIGASGTCSNTAVYTVAVNANPTLAVTGNTAICNGNSTTLTASGATNYTWTSGANTAVAALSPTANTTYSVTGSFTTGCSNTRTIAVTVYSLPVIAITGSNVICAGDTTVLNATGATSYTWSTLANSNTLSVNPPSTTSYTAAGTNSNGCTSFAVRTVTVNARPTFTLSGKTPICAGESKTLSINGANTYTWNNASTGNTIVLTPTLNAGAFTFSVVGTSSAGCSSTLVDSLIVNAIPSLTIAGGSFVCNGNTLTLNASGAATFSWSTGVSTNSVAVTPSVNTSYTVVGTSTAGCVGTAVNDVTVVALPMVSITGNSVMCYGDSLTLVANGANTYTWSNGATSSLVVVKPLVNTTYTLIGEIGSGCSDTTQTAITVNSLPSLSITVASATICAGEQAIIAIDGASTYTWSTASNSNSIAVSPSLTTTYSVIGTGTNNCVSTDSLKLFVSECLSLTKNSLAAQTRVYPNPNSGVFVIEMPASDAEIRIVNVFGQNILNTKANSVNKIDLTAYDKGMYFVYVIQDNEIVFKKAILKD